MYCIKVENAVEGNLSWMLKAGGGGGGAIPIHKLYGDMPPFRVWILDCPLINQVSNSKVFKDFL